MQYLKRNTKYSILAFLVIVLSVTISISTLAKTEVYFSLYENPQILYATSLRPGVHNINVNINTISQYELMKILLISEPVAQKIFDLSFMLFPRMREFIKIKLFPYA